MDLATLRDAVIERVWFSSQEVSFDRVRREVRIPFARERGRLVARPQPSAREGTVVIGGVTSARARDVAGIVYYDIVEIDVAPGSIRIVSNFPYEISLGVDEPVFAIEPERRGDGHIPDGVGGPG